MKAGTLDLMKFKRLKRRLGESDRGTAGLLELLWQRAGKNAPRGDIGKFTDEEIAIMCDYESDPLELIAALVDTGWIDRSEDYRLVVHDWHEHAPNYVKGVAARQGGFVTQGRQPKVSNPEQITMQKATIPNLTSPSLTVASSDEPDIPPLEGDWKKVAEEMGKLGVDYPEDACLSARSRDCLASEAVAVLEHWKSKLGAWAPSKLYLAVKNLRPDKKVWWPPEDPEWLKARERERWKESAERDAKKAVASRIEKERLAEQPRINMLEEFKKKSAPSVLPEQSRSDPLCISIEDRHDC